jgi:hypothetical protein
MGEFSLASLELFVSRISKLESGFLSIIKTLYLGSFGLARITLWIWWS